MTWSNYRIVASNQQFQVRNQRGTGAFNVGALMWLVLVSAAFLVCAFALNLRSKYRSHLSSTQYQWQSQGDNTTAGETYLSVMNHGHGRYPGRTAEMTSLVRPQRTAGIGSSYT